MIKRILSTLLLTSLIGTSLGIASIPVTFAAAGDTGSGGSGSPTAPSTTPSTATSPSSADQLRQLEQQRTTAISQRNQLQTAKRTQEAQLQTLREQRAAISGTDAAATAARTAFDASIRGVEASLAQTNQNLATTTQQISNLDRDVESNPEYRRERIMERYEDLITANLDKHEEIFNKQQACTDCTEAETLRLQLQANEEYQSYLIAKQALELCQLTPRAPCTAENEAVSNASRPLNATIAQLTRLEQEKNSRATFEVSRIFSPTDQPLQRRTFQEIANTVANWMITLVTSLAVTTLIIGGFMMIISGGDENRLEMGKTIFEYSLIGLLVTLMAYGIITFVQSLFYS